LNITGLLFVVKIQIINEGGEVIGSITSDEKGRAEKNLTVPIDKRYFWADPNDIGTRAVMLLKSTRHLGPVELKEK
jgi:hypothetical protein